MHVCVDAVIQVRIFCFSRIRHPDITGNTEAEKDRALVPSGIRPQLV